MMKPTLARGVHPMALTSADVGQARANMAGSLIRIAVRRSFGRFILGTQARRRMNRRQHGNF